MACTKPSASCPALTPITLAGLGVSTFGLSQLGGADVGSGSRSLGAFLAVTVGLAVLARLLRRPASFLPAKSHTLTIMANADRIARHLARTLSGVET